MRIDDYDVVLSNLRGLLPNAGNLAVMLDWIKLFGDELDTRLQGVEGATDGFGDRIDDAEGAINGLNGRMDEAEGAINGLNDRMDEAEGAINGLDGRMDEAEGEITRLDGVVRSFGAQDWYDWQGIYLDIPLLNRDLFEINIPGDSGSFNITDSACVISIKAVTPATASVNLKRIPSLYEVIVDLEKPSMFKTKVEYNANDNAEILIAIGKGAEYGFLMTADSIYGVTYGSSVFGYTILLADDLPSTNTVMLEAKHFPGEKVEFYINGVLCGTQANVNRLPRYSGMSDEDKDRLLRIEIKNTQPPNTTAYLKLAWLKFLQYPED